MNCTDSSLIIIALCISAASITIGLIIGWIAWAPIHSPFDDLEYPETAQARYPQSAEHVARHQVSPTKPLESSAEKRPSLTSDNIRLER